VRREQHKVAYMYFTVDNSTLWTPKYFVWFLPYMCNKADAPQEKLALTSYADRPTSLRVGLSLQSPLARWPEGIVKQVPLLKA
jgi:hypothetical protein